MATDGKKLKGILKNVVSAEQAAADSARSKPPVDPRQIAMQHAHVLQYRKDLESQILDSIVTLSEYPRVRVGRYSSASPARSDVADFKSGIHLFQPSDYDALVEERNVNGLCGYALCPQPRVKQRGGEWKLVSTGIAQRKELEKWCSKACAKRALYVKVQLNETAAWERAGIPDIQIDLLDEVKPEEDPATQTAMDLDRLKLEDERNAAASSTLALERGDSGKAIAGRVMKLTIREKEVKPPKEGVSFADPDDEDNEDEGHLILEGHRTKFGNKKPAGDAP